MKSPQFVSTLCLCVSLILAGCNGRSYQVSSPVLGPVPPRAPAEAVAQSNADSKITKRVRAQDAAIQTVSHEEVKPLVMTDVIAEVNGEPILAHEVLDRYSDKLAQAQPMMKDSEFRKAQMQLISQDLPKLIERTLMVDAMKQTMKPEQLKQVDAQLDKLFDGEVQRMMGSTNAHSARELEGQLQAQGLSLVTLRKQFGDNAIAAQYLRSKVSSDPTASREEMLALYEEEREKSYTEKSQIKWQQIELSYEERGGINAAEKAAHQLLEEIQSGRLSFDQAAHDRSDSSLASRGGHWDWTQPESLSDKDLRDALGKLQVNEVSQVIPLSSCFAIVMLTGRREARVIPFNEVQTELHDKIVKKKKDALMEQAIEELKASAIIHSILDEEEQG